MVFSEDFFRDMIENFGGRKSGNSPFEGGERLERGSRFKRAEIDDKVVYKDITDAGFTEKQAKVMVTALLAVYETVMMNMEDLLKDCVILTKPRKGR